MSVEVVKFSADWCVPCRGFASTWKEAASNYPDITFSAVDCDERPDSVSFFKVKSVPTFIVLENGKEVDRMTGASPSRFYEMLNRWL